MFVCFSLRDKCFSQKPVLIALVCCCLKRRFFWKLGNLQLPRSYRRFKPSELSVLDCRAQGVQPWQSLSPAKRHQFSMQISPWAPLTCKPARHTQKELQTQIKSTKDYSCIYYLSFLLHFTMVMLKILIIFLALVRAKGLLNTTELLPVTVTPLERKAGKKSKFFFSSI